MIAIIRAKVSPFAALPASLCWQLPTYDGTKSYQNLLVGVYGVDYSRDWVTSSNSRNFGGEILISSLLRSGRYNYIYGTTAYIGSEGYYHTKTVTSSDSPTSLAFSSSSTIIRYTAVKGYGFRIRCLVRLVPRQLPTYDGTKSYQNLLVEVYGGKDIGDNRDTIIQNMPANFIRSGNYSSSGTIVRRNSSGRYWYDQVYTNKTAFGLSFGDTNLDPRVADNRDNGYTVRCLVR